MVDDVPSNPSDPFNSFWYFQIAALNVQDLAMLPVRVTYQYADAILPSIHGSLVVWEDYRNDPDGTMSEDWLADDNPDIYICDVTDVTGPGDHFPPAYPICTAPGPQFAPRIAGDIVVWEDWRDTGGMQSDLYLYDLSVDTDGDGTPNWKESPAQRPDPDPAEVRLTDSTWPEEFPDLSGETMVWMDLRRDTGLATLVDIYARDIYGTTASAVATDPLAYREHPRIDGGTAVWEDWRQAQSDIYWIDLATGVSGPIAASAAAEDYPDVSGDRVVYAKHRANVTVGSGGDAYEHAVFNVWIQDMLPGGAVGVHTFSDVPSDFWAWRHVEGAVENAVVQGYPDGSYQPSWVVTRDQMAVYIARALAGGDGNVPIGPPSPSFSDVASDHWAYRYIEYAVAQGVVQGFEDGSYQPALQVDRAQMAVYIARALAGGDLAVPGGPPSPTFPDVPTGFWAYKYVEYIADAGVTEGYLDGLYHPEILCSRDQMAVYVSRAFDYVE
jgi:beta propeller repeat protein